MVTDVAQQEHNNNKCYVSTFRYIYIEYRYRLIEILENIWK